MLPKNMQDSDLSQYFMRKTPSQARSRVLVEAILSAAAQVLRQVGHSDASTNKIALRAGVSIGSLYDYFPGKKAIFAELRRREDRKLFDAIMKRPIPDSVEALIRQHLTLHIKQVCSNLRVYRALVREVPHFAIVEEELPRYKKYVPWAEEFFREHKDEVREFDNIAETMKFIIRVGQATVDSYALNDPDSLHNFDVQNKLIEMFTRYVSKPNLD